MRLQLGLPSLRRGEVADFRFLDERTDPIDLCFAPDGPSDRSDHALEARQRNCPRVDRLPAGRFLQQPGRIEIAIGGEEQRARNGGRRHDERIDAAALLGQGETLMDAEAMLLVDAEQSETGSATCGEGVCRYV